MKAKLIKENLNNLEFKEGDRVKLLANEDEGWEEKIATVLGISEDYPEMMTVEVDKEYREDIYDDGLRELLWKDNVEHLNEWFSDENEDIVNEPFTQNINRVINNPRKIKQMYNDRIKGFYLVKAKSEYRKGWAYKDEEANYTDIDNGKFLMFDPIDDNSFHDYLEDLLGKWSIENADEWSKYPVVDMSTDEEEQIYVW